VNLYKNHFQHFINQFLHIAIEYASGLEYLQSKICRDARFADEENELMDCNGTANETPFRIFRSSSFKTVGVFV
jgi:hypothetical protein